MALESPAAVAERLGGTGYLADDALATVTFLALRMQRPLLLEGEPGTGKTALAEALAREPRPAAGPAAVLRGHRRHPGALRLGLPAADPAPAGPRGGRRRRQGRGASRRPRRACTTPASCSPARCCRRCRTARRCCWSTRSTAPTTSSRRSCSRCSRPTRSPSPSSAPCSAATPPIVVLTSNRTRELHDALKRRCLYHWIEHPGLEREVEILRSRAPEVSEALRRQVVALVQQLRDRARPAEAARCRRDPRLGAGAAPPRHRRDRPRRRVGHARRAGEVPRGRRPGPPGAGPDAEGMMVSTGSTTEWRGPTTEGRGPTTEGRGPATEADAAPRRGADEVLLGFTRALRAAGVAVTQDRAHGFLAAVAVLGLERPAGDLPRRAGHAVRRARRPRALRPGLRGVLQRPRRAAPDAAGPAGRAALLRAARHRRAARATARRPTRSVRAMASDTEVLRHRDVAALSPAERHRLAGMFATLRPRPPRAAYRPAPGLAPRPGRRLPHAARQPAPDGRARRASPGAAAAYGPAGWCCSSTSPAR